MTIVYAKFCGENQMHCGLYESRWLACFLNTTRNHTSNSNVRVHLRSNCALDHFRFQRTSSFSMSFYWSSEQCRFHIRSEITRLSSVLSGKCVLNSKTIGRWNNLRTHKESVFQGHMKIALSKWKLSLLATSLRRQRALVLCLYRVIQTRLLTNQRACFLRTVF